jgi:hypothetical protein
MVDDTERAACAGAEPCNLKIPVAGVVWPARIRDIECGRGFGYPWCFGGTSCPTDATLCPCHSGMDLSLRPGSPVYAIYDGVLTATLPMPGVGVSAVVQHQIPGLGGFTAMYAHLATVEKQVGDPVCAGERLGFVTQFECSQQMALAVRTHFHIAIWQGTSDFDLSTAAWLQPAACNEPMVMVPPFPAHYIDPLCLLRDAPLPQDDCQY